MKIPFCATLGIIMRLIKHMTMVSVKIKITNNKLIENPTRISALMIQSSYIRTQADEYIIIMKILR